ncbi:TMV resistance protein N-like [Bidens hawaiensis]|uniref:TMV resistance protein N-like n=1 Tax=Bidens hawaiensis TaxID=980011 RepID=UPI00404B9947
MQDLDSCLEIGLNDVRMIGIKGMGGAGKTTLARAIFDKIAFNFEGQSFVEDVRENASRSGLEKLQEQVLRDVLKNKDITVSGVHEGKRLMKKMLRGKKVLVVLDDVNHKDQLEMLVGDTSWFGPRSRIIITTRDGQVLEAHKVEWILDVNLLTNEEAICLFNRHAFGKDKPTKEFEKLSQKVLSYASGLPLTIKVLGSYLCGKDASEWADALERLKTIPLKETLKILELSYQKLEEGYKEIFLDVACFLQGWKKDDAIRMLESSGFYARSGLRVLEKKSLITISDDTFDGSTIITMHDHLVEMGMNIVRREHPEEPNKHNRLWVQKEIEHVLSDNTGNEAVRCIDLENTPSIYLEGLGNMKKLRCLIVDRGVFTNGFNGCVKIDEARLHFPNSLRCLFWYNYPHWCLPKTVEANNLVALAMFNSKIEHLWEGGKVMEKLRFLDLGGSKLRSLDLGLTPKLERLNLLGCRDLVKVDVDGGCLKSLVYLNLDYCRGLKSVSFIEELESLEVLNIGNLNLREFPGCIVTGHSSNSLQVLDLSFNRNISEIPSSIGNLHNLVSLNLSDCYSLKSLPGSICSLQHLTALNLDASGIEELPEDVGELESLEELKLDNCSNLREIPSSICKLKRLRVLNLQGCYMVEKLADELGNLGCLQRLDISGTGITHLPQSISLIKGLKIER